TGATGNTGAQGVTGATGIGADNAWLLTGNAGTIEGIHLIGTIDSAALEFRVNNRLAGRIYPSTAAVSTSYGCQALASSSNPFSRNAGFGHNTLGSTATGSSNTAMGIAGMIGNVSGSANVAIGTDALVWNITGNSNPAV